MEETQRKCPGCGRALGPMAARCFYCGADATSPTPKSAGAFTPVSSTALVAAAVPGADPALTPAAAPAAPSKDPNTHCPICKNAILAVEGPAFSCPSCQSRLECLFAGAKALPGSTSVRPGLSEVCINHPTNQAVARCRMCRKAVCDTCVFRGPTGSYCPDCAVKPDEASKRSNFGLSVASLACGILAMLSLGAFFMIAITSRGDKDGQGGAVVMYVASLFLSLIGIGTGFSARDGTKKRSMMGIAGIILSLFVLAIVAFFMILGLGSGR